MDRILLCLPEGGDRNVLKDFFQDRYEVLSSESEYLPAEPFDLGVVSLPTGPEALRAIADRKRKESPVFLPFLALVSKGSFRRFHEEIWDTVDEVIVPPIEPFELEARIRSLLRARAYSKDSRNQYFALAESTPAGVAIVQESKVVYANPIFRSLADVDAKGCLETPFLEFFLEPDQEQVRRLLVDGAGALKLDGFEARMRAAGGPRCVEIRARQIPFRGHEGVLIFLTDITERKTSEAHLRHTDKMEAVGQLAAGIAHDFNNLLAAMSMRQHLLAKGTEMDSPLREHVDEIGHSLDRTSEIIRRLLDFSRVQEDVQERIDLNGLLLGMRMLLESMLPGKVRFNMELCEQPCVICAHTGEMEQVLLNLAANARDAMPEGGSLTMKVWAEKNAERVLLLVSDTGCGMEASTQARIFEPFFTTKPLGKGTGLGLFSVFSIVRKHGGEVNVESQPGAGARFQISMPTVG